MVPFQWLIGAHAGIGKSHLAAIYIGQALGNGQSVLLDCVNGGRHEFFWFENTGEFQYDRKNTLLGTPNRPLQGKILARLEQLRLVMDENVLRLRAAIEASQRRIDAVMAAIREQVADNSPYGANGRISAPSASYARNLRI